MHSQTRAVGARATGRSHVDAGQGCDDAFGWRQFGASVQVLAVADGAGSVSGTSAWGSWAAVQFVISRPVARNLVLDLAATDGSTESAEPILRLLFSGALQHVAYHARRLGLTLEQVYTTLAVAVLTPERTWLAQIGDGIIAVPNGASAQTVLVEEKGDDAANHTHFMQALARNPMSSTFRSLALEPVSAAGLSTDGLRYQATRISDNYAAATGFFEAMWRNVDKGISSAELRSWLAGIPVSSDPPKDDKTLVLAVRSPESFAAEWLEDVRGPDTHAASSPQPPAPPAAEDARTSGSA